MDGKVIIPYSRGSLIIKYKKDIDIMRKNYFGLAILFVVGVILGLTGCGPKNYNLSPPTTVEGQQCVTECRQSKQACFDNCQATAITGQTEQTCLKQAQEQAKANYEEYVSVTMAEGNPISRTADSFFDQSSCKQAVCGSCEVEYRSCYQLCGGRLVAI